VRNYDVIGVFFCRPVEFSIREPPFTVTFSDVEIYEALPNQRFFVFRKQKLFEAKFNFHRSGFEEEALPVSIESLYANTNIGKIDNPSDELLVKCGEYESSLTFPLGECLSAGSRTGTDIQLGEATDDGPIYVTLENLGGGNIRVTDRGAGAVLVNSAAVENQPYSSPIVLTLPDLGVDLHLALESESPTVTIRPTLPSLPPVSSGLPPVPAPTTAGSAVPPSSSPQIDSGLPPLPDPASPSDLPPGPRSPVFGPKRLKVIIVTAAGLVVTGLIAAAFVFHRTKSNNGSPENPTNAPVSAAAPAPTTTPVTAAASNPASKSAGATVSKLLEEAKQLEESKEIPLAVEKYKRAAELGNAEAWNALGVLTVQEGESKAPEAFGYFSKAADGGYARGVYNQGLCYLDGVGTTKDQAKAVAMFQKASDLGNPEAMVALASAYENGTGGTVDANQAFRWYEKAADAGNLDAVVSLGKAYAEGNGVTRDETKAAVLFERAAAQDRADAINNLGVLYAKGLGVAKDLEKAKALYAKSAGLGNSDAQDNLKALESEIVANQKATSTGRASEPADPDRKIGNDVGAAKQFERAAAIDRASKINKINSGETALNDTEIVTPESIASENFGGISTNSSQKTDDFRVLTFEEAMDKANAGDAYAQAVVSIYYGVGYKTNKDVEKSAAYALQSAKQGHPLGIYRVGVMRQTGEGMEKSEEQGRKLKAQSVDGLNNMGGDPYALTALGVMLYQGEVINENKSEAVRVFELAADQDYAPAQYSYAVCLDRGIGVEKDPDLAKQYLAKAVTQFYPPALDGMPK